MIENAGGYQIIDLGGLEFIFEDSYEVDFIKKQGDFKDILYLIANSKKPCILTNYNLEIKYSGTGSSKFTNNFISFGIDYEHNVPLSAYGYIFYGGFYDWKDLYISIKESEIRISFEPN